MEMNFQLRGPETHRELRPRVKPAARPAASRTEPAVPGPRPTHYLAESESWYSRLRS